MSQVDQTANMPSESWDGAAGAYDALNDAVFGGKPLDTKALNMDEQDFSPSKQPGATDLDSLEQVSSDQQQVPQVSKEEPKPSLTKLKVNGKEVEFDLSDEAKLKEYLQIGMAAQQKLKSAKQIRRENEELKAQLSKLQSSNQNAQFEKARKLMEQGHKDHALRTLLGEDNYSSYLSSKVDEMLEYREADPMRKLEIESKWEQERLKLQEDERLEEIQRLREQLEEQQTNVTTQQYSSYLEGARSAYDLSKWIEDGDMAGELNDSLQTAANAEIVREQEARELAQEQGRMVPDLNEKDIRKIYHKHARRFLKYYKTLSTKVADQQIEQQAQKAQATAQIASERNYQNQDDLLSKWSKSGGSMTDLLAAMAGKKSIL